MKLRKVSCALIMATVMALAGCSSGKTGGSETTEETESMTEPETTEEPTTIEELTTTEEPEITEDIEEPEDGYKRVSLPMSERATKELKKLLLKDAEDQCRDVTSAKGDSEYGTPPRAMYIYYSEVVSGVSEKYLFKNGKMEQVDPDAPEEEMVKDGMYWSVGSISIKIHEDRGKVDLSYVYGPLYGSGYTYEIIEDDDGVRPGRGEMSWIS